MFILTSDLKKGGYGRKDIKIEINEDGSRMTISGEKSNIQFHKTFIIPEGVVLDKVKARFDQDQSRLTIRMPKLVKGLVTGTGIQEYKHLAPAPAKGITSDQHKEDVDEETKQEPKPDSQAEKPENKTSSTIYTTPVIAGSTLFVSLIVVFFSFIRSRNQSSKKTN
ncbi:hypothetical protein L1987_52446 [Smallanthus sonchifolius]|uniref:Uncharacterized protein n=1 Tax=Smallanthus sonchifolius TaxID=185202 RepID=A0ACB9ESI5_9ASTR|nr:hypothetical protein L1987_52446 [Smallanthus sonchifolius]